MLNPYHWNDRQFKPAVRLAGLEQRTCYEMRHTYATLALAAGATLEWIGAQMGHTNITTTRRHYARFVKRVDDRMRALLNENFTATSESDGHKTGTSPIE